MTFTVIGYVIHRVGKNLEHSRALFALFIPGCARFPQELIKIRFPAIFLHVDPTFDNGNVLHNKALGLPIISPAALLKSNPAGRRDDAVPRHIGIGRQLPQRIPDLASAARYAGNLCNLAVACN